LETISGIGYFLTYSREEVSPASHSHYINDHVLNVLWFIFIPLQKINHE
jgi:hypothetical protein